MEKYFLETLHEGEIINGASLEMLKGGVGLLGDCLSLTTCVCYGKYEINCYPNNNCSPNNNCTPNIVCIPNDDSCVTDHIV